MLDPRLLEHARDQLAFLDGDRADQERPAASLDPRTRSLDDSLPAVFRAREILDFLLRLPSDRTQRLLLLLQRSTSHL